MSNGGDLTQLTSDVSDVKNQVSEVSSELDFIINKCNYFRIQKRLKHFTETIYNGITDAALKKELFEYSIICQTSLLCGDYFEFGKYLFFQIESIINFGLFKKIGIVKINADLQNPQLTHSYTNQTTQVTVTKPLVNHIFDWRTDKQIIAKITSKQSIEQKDFQFTELANLYYYYFMYVKQITSRPSFDLTETVRLIRTKSSHGQSNVADSKGLIPIFEGEFNSDHYQLCHKYYLHIKKFTSAL